MEVLGMKKIVWKIHKGAYQCETVEFSDMNVELSELNDPAPPSVQTCFTVGEWIAVAYSNKWHPGIAIAMSPQKHSITIRFLDASAKIDSDFLAKMTQISLMVVQDVNYHSIFA
jgi:hypothetical protein